MKVTWKAIPDEALASYRYRVRIPMEHMRADGIDATLNSRDADVVIFSKHWDKAGDPVLARQLIKAGKKVVMDICDDHFGTEHRDHYIRMCDLADAVVVCTERLKERVLEETGRDAKVISDPYEYPEHPVRFINEPPVLFWHGHANNAPSLARELPRLVEYQKVIVGNVPGATPWSKQAVMDGFAHGDIAIIPTTNTLKNQAKSPNRMVEAIRQGRFVVANPMPSYEEFGLWTGDIVEGIEWVRKNRKLAMERVKAAQALVRLRHEPLMLARSWASLCASILGAETSSGPTPSTWTSPGTGAESSPT